MDIDVFPQHELPTVFRALRTALAPSGALDAHERLFLDTYARITGFDLQGREPMPVSAQAVSIAGAHPRKRLVQLGALAVLLNRPVRADAFAYLEALARHLDTYDPVIAVIDALIRGRHLEVRLLTMRRAFRVLLKEALVAEGPMGVLRVFGAMLFKAAVNKDKRWHYRRLGLLAEGTLGREYWKFMAERGYGLPGDAAGIPRSISYHDIAHILAEHETTPLGEIQQGSFQGGNRREDGFSFIQMVILQFHHGVRVTPATGGRVGNFHPDKVLWAIHRGARCNVDMTHQWDYWPLMPLPLAEARARCALLPKLPAAATLPQPA
jgi:hypothetical protein